MHAIRSTGLRLALPNGVRRWFQSRGVLDRWSWAPDSCLPELGHEVARLEPVHFRVVLLRHHRAGVAQQDARGLQAGLGAKARRGGMAKLVRVPVDDLGVATRARDRAAHGVRRV